MAKLTAALSARKDGLIFANLVDFDMLYGHRKDVEGFARSLEEFDALLGPFLALLGESDLLIITADHGCDPDPVNPTTDHSREYVPILAYGPAAREGQNLGTARHTRRHGADDRRKFRRLDSARHELPASDRGGELIESCGVHEAALVATDAGSFLCVVSGARTHGKLCRALRRMTHCT